MGECGVCVAVDGGVGREEEGKGAGGGKGEGARRDAGCGRI